MSRVWIHLFSDYEQWVEWSKPFTVKYTKLSRKECHFPVHMVFRDVNRMYWLCSLYKELDYKSQKYYVIFQLTGGMGTKLHFKSSLHKKLKGRKIYPVSDVGRHLCCCLGYHFFKMTKCLICGLMVSVTCVNILTHSAHLGELYLNPLSSVPLICRWHEFLFLSFPHRPLCFLLSTESNKDKNDGVLHNG